MLDLSALRAQLDHERRTLIDVGFVREASADTVRHVAKDGRLAFVIWTDPLPSFEPDSTVRATLAALHGRVTACEWKTYGHDPLDGLESALQRAGFAPDEPETVLVADTATIAAAAEPLLPGVEFRRLDDPNALQDLASVQREVWGKDRPGSPGELAEELRADPTRLHIHAVYAGGQPVACAWLRLPAGSAFAGLWGGSTVAAWRGQGIYRTLVVRRARAALAAGYRILYIDASEASRPILERCGFQRLTTTRPWRLTAF